MSSKNNGQIKQRSGVATREIEFVQLPVLLYNDICSSLAKQPYETVCNLIEQMKQHATPVYRDAELSAGGKKSPVSGKARGAKT